MHVGTNVDMAILVQKVCNLYLWAQGGNCIDCICVCFFKVMLLQSILVIFHYNADDTLNFTLKADDTSQFYVLLLKSDKPEIEKI